eukprot:4854863-Ditylum_brightwellii.AAC.1
MPPKFISIWTKCNGAHCSGLGVVPVFSMCVDILAKLQTNMAMVVHMLSSDESARAEGGTDGWG